MGRLDLPDGKEIRQRQPDGAGGWKWKLDGARRVVWRLPDVLRAGVVFVCEGEKAAERLNEELQRAGYFGDYVATTNAQGAGKWQNDFSAAFDAASGVGVIPDFDGPGDAHSETVCASISARGKAGKVARLDLPNLPEKGDVCDYFDAGGTLDNLLALWEDCGAWTPHDGESSATEATKARAAEAFKALPLAPDFPPFEAARVPVPLLRTERGAPDFDGRQLVEVLYPHWDSASLLTHVAMGKRAGDALGGVLRYIPALGWLWFDGKKWTLDDKASTGAAAGVAALSERVRAEGAALFHLAGLLAQCGRVPDAEAMGRAATLQLRHTKQVEARGFIEGALSFAAAHPALRSTVETFSVRPFVLGFSNGVWDKGEFRPHRREDFLLHVCPVDFEALADRHEWEAVLERMTGGDVAFARNLQDVAGYVLAGAPNLRTLPWLYGPKGTGKSTFAELLQTVLGEQSAQIDTRALDGSDSRERLGASLWNRRLAVCSESGNKKLDKELLKTLSGGDRLPVRQLYKEAFTTIPRHVLVMVSNDAPKLDAYDPALKDRVMALPFEHPMDDGPHFELTSADGAPLARLEAARVDPTSSLVLGFTAWALDGLARVHRTQSIERAPSVVAATAKFWSDTDTLTPFWEALGDEQFDALNAKGLTKTELRRIYDLWCEEEGARPVGRHEWARACESHGLEDCWLYFSGATQKRGWRFKTPTIR